MFRHPTELAVPPDLTLHDVHLSQFKSGVLTTRATAAELQYTRNSGHLEGRTGTLYPAKGNLTGGVLTTGLAVGSTKSGVADLSHGAHWVSAVGDDVTTSACTINLVDQVATGHEHVTVQGTGYQIEAGAFVSHYGRGGDFEFSQGVHVQMAESNIAGAAKSRDEQRATPAGDLE